MFNSVNNDVEPDVEKWEKSNEQLPHTESLDCPVSEGVAASNSKLKQGKASGLDNMLAEMLTPFLTEYFKGKVQGF